MPSQVPLPPTLPFYVFVESRIGRLVLIIEIELRRVPHKLVVTSMIPPGCFFRFNGKLFR